MSDSTERGAETGPAGPEDVLAVVERIRSVPRARPSAAFRMRMSLYSRLPSLGYRLVNRREASLIERRILGNEYGSRPGWAVSAARVAAAVALIVVLAVGTFGVLTVAARNSNPGDALYSIKRMSEDLELAFTWDNASRVEKSLLLAQKRLSELDYLISRKELDASRVAEVAGDYSEKTRTVEDILLSDGRLENAKGVAAQLKEVKSAEKKIEKRLAAAGTVATLAPAGGAGVTIRDVSGRKSFGGRDYYSAKAGADGKLSFPADLEGPAAVDSLEVSIELDGRREVLPVYRAAAPAGGPLKATVTPAVESLLLDSPQLFTMTLVSETGARIRGLSLRLRDTSGTGYVNGTSGEAALLTDSEGRCSFTVEKKSLERVSRISARVLDGAGQDLGEVLVLGGLEAPGAGRAQAGGVTARASGPAGGPQTIELDNGLVRVAVSAAAEPGTVVGSVTRTGEPGAAGPLREPAYGIRGTVPVSTAGPYLAYSGPAAAGYDVSFRFDAGGAVFSKTYRVSLSRDDRFATVECRMAVEGEPGAGSLSGMLDFALMEAAPSREVVASGKSVVPSQGEASLVRFDVAEPYAVFDSGAASVFYACPLGSEAYPSAWAVDTSGVALRLSESELRSGKELTVTAILSVTGADGVGRLEGTALRGVAGGSTASSGETASDGFLLTVSPAAPEMREGEQYMTLGVYKRYQKVFGD